MINVDDKQSLRHESRVIARSEATKQSIGAEIASGKSRPRNDANLDSSDIFYRTTRPCQ